MKSHKEMKQEYKLYKPQKGVYQIKNKKNGKVLIGGSTDLKAIWNRHRAQLNFGSHPNKELQSEWNYYGEESFEYEIIAEIKEKDDEEKDYKKEVKELEELYIEELKPFGVKGYNKK
jgi:group I intron endonuclease